MKPNRLTRRASRRWHAQERTFRELERARIFGNRAAEQYNLSQLQDAAESARSCLQSVTPRFDRGGPAGAE